MLWTVTGDRTGRTWSYHVTADSQGADPGFGERWSVADVSDGSVAYYHQYRKSDDYAAEIARMRTAIDVATLPEIAASPVIVRLLDVHETEATTGEWGVPGLLGAVWEFADLPLNKFQGQLDCDGRAVADDVERNVGQALDELHALGWIHCDVAPNNVLRVEGRWKLADLDSCTRRGELSTRKPADRYLHPRRQAGDALADGDFDRYGVCVIANELRGG